MLAGRIKVSQVGGISAYLILIEGHPHLTHGKLLHSCWVRGIGGRKLHIYKSRHRIQAVFRQNATPGIESAVKEGLLGITLIDL